MLRADVLGAKESVPAAAGVSTTLGCSAGWHGDCLRLLSSTCLARCQSLEVKEEALA